MKQVTVTARGRLTQIVQLNSVESDAQLTPKMARAAARLAFGNDEFKTVCDFERCYRITSKSHTRRVVCAMD